MTLISRFVWLLAMPLLFACGVWAQEELQIHVIGGDASIAGRLIEVTGANGLGIPDVAVVFRLPDTGPTGTFPDGTHAAVAYTNQDGRVLIPRIQWDSSAGLTPIRVSATKGTAHAGILVEQNANAAAASAPLVPGVVPLPIPSPAPVQQPGSIARETTASATPTQAPAPEPRVTVTSATPQSEAHTAKAKWIVIAAIAIGAGVGVAMAMKGKSSSTTPTTSATTVSYSGLGVGQPPH
jgi:hypothetical protein